MKISYEKHGVEGVENCLTYLAAFDADDIESDEFEIIGEDEEGREGSADISIINLAEEACKALAAQRKRIAELEEREAALAAHVEAIKDHAKYVGWKAPHSKLGILLRNGPEKSPPRRDLVNHELAASLERIVDAWMYDDTGIHDNHGHGVMLPTARYQGVNQAIMDSRLKGASLKRRDLIKQAEVLEDQVEKMRDNADSARDNGYGLQAAGMEDAADFLAADAAGLRRQAEAMP